MKITRLLSLSAVAVFAIAVGVNSNMAHAAGGTATWTDGTGDHKFSTTGNWAENAIPEAGDLLIFDTLPVGTPTVPSTYLVDNDVAVSFSGVKTQGTVLANTVSLQLQNDLSLSAGSVWNVDENVKKLGVSMATGKKIQIAGNFTATNGYLPLFQMAGGVLTVQKQAFMSYTAFTSGASSVVVENGAQIGCLAHLSDYHITTPVTLGGGASTGSASLIFGRCAGGMGGADVVDTLVLDQVTLAADAQIGVYTNDIVQVNALNANGHTLSRITGADGTLVLPSGTQSTVYEPKTTALDGDQATTGVTVLPNETAVLNGVRGSTFVRAGGILKGNGTLGDLTVLGTVSPGNSPGTITMTGSLQLATDSVYTVEVASKDSYDKLIANGVMISDAILDLQFLAGAKVSAGDAYTIISNTDGTNPVNGTFKNLPEGATFTAQGGTFKISYAAGDGNDVTLTVVSVPNVPNTGVEAIVRANPALIAGVTVVTLVALAVAGRLATMRR